MSIGDYLYQLFAYGSLALIIVFIYLLFKMVKRK